MYLLRLRGGKVPGKGIYGRGTGAEVHGKGGLEQLHSKLKLELLNKQTLKDAVSPTSHIASHHSGGA
jgi:hypothetical protein